MSLEMMLAVKQKSNKGKTKQVVKKSEEKNQFPFFDKWKEDKRIRIAVKLLLAGVAMIIAFSIFKPIVEDVIAQSYATKAVSKGRVLMRGAQVVTREQMVAGNPAEDVQQHLVNPQNLDHIVTTAKFPVAPEEILEVRINQRGEIDLFVCRLVYEDKRYDVTLDIVTDTSVARLDESYIPPEV